MIVPDYDASLLTISAALVAHYGGTSAYPANAEIMRRLARDPKNVVLILLDGMGDRLLTRLLPPDGFFRSHRVGALCTVFPPTTTAATTSLWTGLSPAEHGWLGWSLYFRECGRAIDIFRDCDSYTHTPYPGPSPAERALPFETICGRIRAAGAAVRSHAIFPFPTYAGHDADDFIAADTFDQALAKTRAICTERGRQLVLLYHNEPDHTMHLTGITSAETKAAFAGYERKVAALCNALSDTLVIVTADHGLVDMNGAVAIDQEPDLAECLIMPPSIELRAATFFVKPHRLDDFARLFRARHGDDFVLLSRAEVLAAHLFGPHSPHPRFDDFLGDYLAVAIHQKYLCFTAAGLPSDKGFIAQHAGATEDEMQIPLILIDCEKKS